MTDAFRANPKFHKLTTHDQNAVLEELYQHSNQLKFLIKQACTMLPDIVDAFEGCCGALIDEDDETSDMVRQALQFFFVMCPCAMFMDL